MSNSERVVMASILAPGGHTNTENREKDVSGSGEIDGADFFAVFTRA